MQPDPRKSCPQCKAGEKCYAHCKESATGLHEADPRSAQQADGTDFVVDYYCRRCHQSGAARVQPADIQWD